MSPKPNSRAVKEPAYSRAEFERDSKGQTGDDLATQTAAEGLVSSPDDRIDGESTLGEHAASPRNGPGTPTARLDWFADELGKRWTDPEPLSAQAFEPRFLLWLDELLALLASPARPRTYTALEISELIRPFGLIIGVETDGTPHIYNTPEVGASSSATPAPKQP